MVDKGLKSCLKCGHCLSVCPVYHILRDERVAPRAKAHLAGAEVPMGDERAFRFLMDHCLQCGRCSRSCKAGLDLASLIHRLRLSTPLPIKARFAAALVVSHGPRAANLAAAMGIVPRIAESAPPLDGRSSALSGESRSNVVFFPGCMQSGPFAPVAHALKSALGMEPVAPDFGCCGLPAWSAGMDGAARRAAARNLQLLQGVGFDLILTGCSSCAHMMAEVWPALFSPEDPLYGLAQRVSAAVRESAQWLGEGAGDLKPIWNRPAKRVAFHLPCHRPRGFELAPVVDIMEAASMDVVSVIDRCCGHAGLFRLANPALSKRVGGVALDEALKSGAEYVVTFCSGCLAQWTALCSEVEIKALHLVDALYLE